MQKPKKIWEKIVFDSPFRKVIQKDFIVKDWTTHNYMVTSQWDSKRAWTMALTITNKWEIIYWKEFRYWTEEFIAQFPVWILEEDLSEVENIKKELKEEVWYDSDNIEYIWDTTVWNYDDTIIKHYIARDCYSIWWNTPEVWEYIEVCKTSIEDFEEMIRSWKVKCPLTLSCWSLAKSKKLI